ncbi:MAG: CpaF family protein [Eubacterium sp.]|nr:CpaF family protein [Eubacterium sp.]
MRRKLREELDERDAMSEDEIGHLVDELILSEGTEAHLSLYEKEALRKELMFSVRKLDVLQELVDDPEVNEIMINGYRNIFYEKGGKLHRWEREFPSRERLEDVIQSIAGSCNRIVNEQRPIADARLPDNGARVNIVLYPIALEGPILTIRRFPDDPITMRGLIRNNSLTSEAAEFLRDLTGAAYSILVGGGTSTGKTTFLNALSAYIPKTDRVITIEDNAELQIQGIDNLVRLEARNANLEGTQEITIRDLIKTALRMRPDRLIVGEVRGAEAGDFLIGLNTGHSGSLGTAHANSVRDMISRIEMMVLMGIALPVPVIRRQIAGGVEILVQLTRDADGRRAVDEIAEIDGMQGDDVCIRTIYKRNMAGKLEKKAELKHREKLEKYYERRKRHYG